MAHTPHRLCHAAPSTWGALFSWGKLLLTPQNPTQVYILSPVAPGLSPVPYSPTPNSYCPESFLLSSSVHTFLTLGDRAGFWAEATSRSRLQLRVSSALSQRARQEQLSPIHSSVTSLL